MAVARNDVGGCAVSFTAALDDAPGVLVKGSQALLFGWHIKNTTGAALYVQIFDAAALADVSLGTTAPTLSIGLAASDSSTIGFPMPVNFVNGIAIFSTTTVNGSSAAISDVAIFYA